MRYSSRWAAVLAAFVAVLALALPAIGDTVSNDVSATNPAAFEWQGSDSVIYTLTTSLPDTQTGCNANDGTALTFAVNAAAATPLGLSASPTSVEFDNCGSAAARTRSIAYSASAPGIYTLPTSAYTATDSGGGTYTLPAQHQVFAYDLESFTVNPAADPLNCFGVVTDAWEPGDTVCARVFPIPNTMSASGALTFEFQAPGGATTSVVGTSGGNRSVATLSPEACGSWTTRLKVTATGAVLDTDTFEVCSPPELTVPTDITVDTNDPAGARVSFVATAVDLVHGANVALTPTCSPASGSVFPVGTTTVECSVTDASGLSDTGSFDVTVDLYQAAFGAPIDGPSVVNVAKVGRVIPVKAAVSMNGGAVTSGPVTMALRSWAGCGTGSPDGIESFAPAGSANEGDAFRWADGGWIYNLDTSGLAPGCYQGQVLTDGHLAGWFLIRLAR